MELACAAACRASDWTLRNSKEPSGPTVQGISAVQHVLPYSWHASSTPRWLQSLSGAQHWFVSQRSLTYQHRDNPLPLSWISGIASRCHTGLRIGLFKALLQQCYLTCHLLKLARLIQNDELTISIFSMCWTCAGWEKARGPSLILSGLFL